LKVLCVELRMASGTPDYAEREDALFLVFNAGSKDVTVRLPPIPGDTRWSHRVATATGWFGAEPLGRTLDVPGPSVAACVLEVHND
jgi:isoamylase